MSETLNRMLEVRNPGTRQLVGSVPDHTAEQLAARVGRLRAAQPEWEDLSATARADWLRALQDWLFDNAERLADVLQSETAKPRVDAGMEVPFIADVIGYYADNAARFLRDRPAPVHSPAGRLKHSTTRYRPYPVVGVITPWNYPLALPGVDAVPALLAGAAVVVKPSEVTPLSALELARGWAEIGAPPVFDVVTGSGETGAAVVNSVDYVQFTGSTHTGRAIAQVCASRLIPCGLELGGKDAALVLSDADIGRAVRGIAFGGLLNSGQMCTSTERVYVEAPVYDRFVTELTALVGGLRQGVDDRGFHYDIGSLATDTQAELVRRHVDEAVAAGARITVGGKETGQGACFEPTVLVDVDHSMSCMREETFGPTLPVMRVADEDAAVHAANDSEYGLSATVWTRDRARGQRIARRLEAGTVNINDSHNNLFALGLPMGGWKKSGIGARFGGAHGIRKYCRVQGITADRLPIVPSASELLWFPYSKHKARLATGAIRMLRARGSRKLSGDR